MRYFFAFVSSIVIISTYFPLAQAGQISVINPSAGSEITGVVSVAPQPSSSISSSSSPTSDNINSIGKVGESSSKYMIYQEFFNRNTFKNFTKDQLLVVNSKLHEILSSNKIEKDIKDLIQEQLVLLKQQLD